MKSYDETPWYAEIEDADAFWAAIRRQFAGRVDELTDDCRRRQTWRGIPGQGGAADRCPLPGRRDHQARVRPTQIRRRGQR